MLSDPEVRRQGRTRRNSTCQISQSTPNNPGSLRLDVAPDPESALPLGVTQSPAGPLRDYLETPFPKPSADYRDLVLLAVDIETTGLDPRRDDILSLGWVSVRRDRIDLGDAYYRLVRAARAIPEASAIVHRITDD